MQTGPDGAANPRTGENVPIAAPDTPSFKAEKPLGDSGRYRVRTILLRVTAASVAQACQPKAQRPTTESRALGTLVAGTITKFQPERQQMPDKFDPILRITKTDILICLDIISRRAEEQKP